MNYNDNLARFFNSQPKTLTAKEAAIAMTDDQETSPSPDDGKDVKDSSGCGSQHHQRVNRQSGNEPGDGDNSCSNNSSSNKGRAKSKPDEVKTGGQRAERAVPGREALLASGARPEGGGQVKQSAASSGRRQNEAAVAAATAAAVAGIDDNGAGKKNAQETASGDSEEHGKQTWHSAPPPPPPVVQLLIFLAQVQ